MRQEAMDKEYRRCRSDLNLLGSGVIVLTVWELVKSFLVSMLVPDAGKMVEIPEALEGFSDGLIVFFAAIFLVWFFFDIFLRFYIGFAARAEASGKRRGDLYVIFSFVLFTVQLSVLVLGLAQFIASGVLEGSVIETVVSLFVEITSLVITGELAFTAIRFKKLSGQEAE